MRSNGASTHTNDTLSKRTKAMRMPTFDSSGTTWKPPRSSATMEGCLNFVAKAALIGFEMT